MNILVNEKNNILQTSSALSPGINLKLEALFSYIYCKTIKTINLDRNEYSTYFLKKGFSEETLKAQLSAFIDFVKENHKEIYDTLKKENDAYDFNEVLSVYSKCLKENPSKFFGIIALCAQKELEENFRSCVLDNFYKNWIETNNLRPEVLPEILSEEIKTKIIEISKCDARSVIYFLKPQFLMKKQIKKSLFFPRKNWKTVGKTFAENKTEKNGNFLKNSYTNLKRNLSQLSI
jgi:hypothetical protein